MNILVPQHRFGSEITSDRSECLPMPDQSPPEKNQLSYERDRRNGYGENSQSSRQNIRRRKQGVNQANRHAAKQLLGVVDPQTGEPQPGSGAVVRRPQTWRKVADIPLGDMVAKQLFRRARLGIASPESVEAAVERVASHRQRRPLNEQ